MHLTVTYPHTKRRFNWASLTFACVQLFGQYMCAHVREKKMQERFAKNHARTTRDNNDYSLPVDKTVSEWYENVDFDAALNNKSASFRTVIAILSGLNRSTDLGLFPGRKLYFMNSSNHITQFNGTDESMINWAIGLIWTRWFQS